ncbi:hypothetical protein VTJ04DRAFT_1060 [Mycothermus thermophilus]|uniref:uncharacterized protein n=1 Tax=Humicola insolens TaxID=85995 RepID=UPI003743B5A8
MRIKQTRTSVLPFTSRTVLDRLRKENQRDIKSTSIELPCTVIKHPSPTKTRQRPATNLPDHQPMYRPRAFQSKIKKEKKSTDKKGNNIGRIKCDI